MFQFPRDLSYERINMLSPEDKEIYFKEKAMREQLEQGSLSDLQSGCYGPYAFERKSHYVFDDEDFVNELITEENLKEIEINTPQFPQVNDDFITHVVNEEIDNMIREFSDVLTEEDVRYIREEYRMLSESEDFQIDEEDDNLLVEGAEGYDCTEWIRGLAPKVGWLGKALAAGLTALGVGLGYLITVGKDKLAMARLKRYMNRLVEITDQGVFKKRPWYSVFLPKKSQAYKETGEYNMGCFRSIQELVDKDVCVTVMVAAKQLGYFGPGSMMNIASGSYPQTGGGLDAFKTNLADRIQSFGEMTNDVDD